MMIWLNCSSIFCAKKSNSESQLTYIIDYFLNYINPKYVLVKFYL